MQIPLGIGILLLRQFAIANDGFYQGAGSTLTPISNHNLEVLTETLNITPLKIPRCYQLTFGGKLMKDTKTVSKGGAGSIGKKVSCAEKKGHSGGGDILMVRWRAEAVYRVKALKDQTNVQIGFPVPDWRTDRENPGSGLEWISFPGVTNFQTFVDGKPIKDLATKSVEVPEGEKKKTAPAFVWNLDFIANTEYELKTDYEFGNSYSVGFSAGRDYPEGKTLWFDTRSLPESKYGGVTSASAETVIYYLSPIKLWGTKPPQRITVQVTTPTDLPVYYLTPNTKGLRYVDKERLVFEWKNAFPEGELHISYPLPGTFPHNESIRPMKRDYEFLAWLDLMGHLSTEKPTGLYGGELQLGCDLVGDLKNRLGKASILSTWQKNGTLKCVPTPTARASTQNSPSPPQG